MEQLLISGDMWIMAGGWNSTYMAVARALAESNPEATLEYIAPVEGRFGWLCGYGIAADAQNVDMAYNYIDALISPESQAYLTNTFGFGGANPESLSMVDEETVQLLQLDQTDILNDTIFLPDVSDELREAYTTIWDNVKLAP
jgi:spermidine/putrescine-binding protein